MLFNNNIGTHLNELDTSQSKSRFLIAQNRSKQLKGKKNKERDERRKREQ